MTPQPSQSGGTSTKPVGDALGWILQHTRELYRGKTFTLTSHDLHLPDGAAMTYEYEQRPPSVIVIPVTPEGNIILIRQYRYPVDQWCLETPAGGSHDTGGMTLQEVAQKELLEECGGTSDDWIHVGSFHPAPSYADEESHIYLAWDTVMTQDKATEPSEAIQIIQLSIPEAIQAAMNGDIHTGPCALALLRSQPLLQHRFPAARSAPI